MNTTAVNRSTTIPTNVTPQQIWDWCLNLRNQFADFSLMLGSYIGTQQTTSASSPSSTTTSNVRSTSSTARSRAQKARQAKLRAQRAQAGGQQRQTTAARRSGQKVMTAGSSS